MRKVARLDTPELLHSFGFFPKDAHVLDMGCGQGNIASRLFRYPISSYLGIDCNSDRIAYAKARGLGKKFVFIHLDIRNDPYNPSGEEYADELVIQAPDASFDSIICHSLFTHLQTESAAERYISELTRVLKKDGLLWTTWFTNPPNLVNESGVRTVYSIEFLYGIMKDHEIIDAYGGITTGTHDQMELVTRRKK